MGNYVKVVDGKNTLYLLPVKKEYEGTIFLDATRVVKPAINKDRRNRYETEKGPNFAIEMQRAIEYAEFLTECDITTRNYHKFGTRRGFSLFLQADA